MDISMRLSRAEAPRIMGVGYEVHKPMSIEEAEEMKKKYLKEEGEARAKARRELVVDMAWDLFKERKNELAFLSCIQHAEMFLGEAEGFINPVPDVPEEAA